VGNLARCGDTPESHVRLGKTKQARTQRVFGKFIGKMKKWMEKEFSQFVYYDEADGKIIGAVYKIGNQNSIYGAKINADVEGILGQYIDSDYARRAVEEYWEIQSRTLLE